MFKNIVLASKSKVRKQILDKNDISSEVCASNVDEDVAFQIAENAQGRTYWEKKSAIEKLCDGQQVHSTSLRLFFQYNETWCRKPKTTFVRIKWFKQPAAYEGRMTEKEGWYPADWVRSK